jgi:hypothetical protein
MEKDTKELESDVVETNENVALEGEEGGQGFF